MSDRNPSDRVWVRHGQTYVVRRDPASTTGGKVPVGQLQPGTRPASKAGPPEPTPGTTTPPGPPGPPPGDAADRASTDVTPDTPTANPAGPFCAEESLCAWLRRSPQQVADLARNQEILAVEAADGSTIYPAWQFTVGGGTIPHLREVLSILSAGIDDPLTWALWLSTPDDDLGGLTSAQWLAAARDPEPVLTEAARDAARWAT